MTEPERALEGLEEIAAYLERLWRQQRNLRVRVSRRTVQRALRRGLPAERVAGGPWIAVPSEVATWWQNNRQSSTRTVHLVRSVRSAPSPVGGQ